MRKQEAEKILKDKAEKEAAEIQAVKTLEEAKIKEEAEKIEAEKLRKREEYEAEKKLYPKKAGEIYMPCWNCKNKKINMSSGEHICKFSLGKVVIVAVCKKCGSYNIAAIPTNTQTSSDYDRFLTAVNLN